MLHAKISEIRSTARDFVLWWRCKECTSHFMLLLGKCEYAAVVESGKWKVTFYWDFDNIHRAQFSRFPS